VDVEPGHEVQKVNAGCKHCYAERMTEGLRARRQPSYKQAMVVSEYGPKSRCRRARQAGLVTFPLDTPHPPALCCVT
jgi:hypothetical protein